MQTFQRLRSNLLTFVAQRLEHVRWSSSSQPSEFINANLHNGVGRYVCQLQRITFKFCKEHPSSRGIRDFIENDLLDFTKKNPGIVVYLQPKRHRMPKLHAEYLNGSVQTIDVSMFPKQRLANWLEFLRTRKGDTIMRLLKKQKTVNPSIQGVWNPFTNKRPSLAIESYPSAEYQTPTDMKKTATQKILELAKRIKPRARLNFDKEKRLADTASLLKENQATSYPKTTAQENTNIY